MIRGVVAGRVSTRFSHRKRGNAVLLAEKDWDAINETLYLVSIPGMRESIRQGLQTGLRDSQGRKSSEGAASLDALRVTPKS